MSTHPNVMLQCVIKPDDGSRKTARAIGKNGDCEEGPRIAERDWHMTVMEDTYDDGYQISADEGDIVVWLFLTYGYGESATWDEVQARVAEVTEWADSKMGDLKFSYAIRIGANYW